MKLEDRLKKVNKSAYIDPEHINDEDLQQLVDQFNAGNIMQPANTLSDWLSQKMHGHDVRNSLAFWTVIMATIADLMRTDETTFKRLLGDRQDQVEGRQTSLEQDFKTVQQGATNDTETKAARNSDNYGAFPVLDDRLENIERIMIENTPVGYAVTIKHNLNRNPAVKAQYYEYGLGLEPDGLGTGPEGSFGGTGFTDVPVKVQYTDPNTCIVNMPMNYTLDNPPEKKPDGNWYVIQDYKAIQIKLI